MREHTKGQWTAKYDSTGGNSVFILSNDNGAFAHYSCWRRNNGEPFKPHPEDEANAAFIVKACNCHDELVEALDALRNAGNNEELIAASTLADAALAKASGK